MQIRYIVREGFSGFKRAKLSMFAAIVTVSISLLLLSIFAIMLLNANSVIATLRDKVEMEAFLDDALDPGEIDSVKHVVAQIAGVGEVRFVSKEEAAKIFQEEFGEDIHKVLDFNPLPSSLKIFLKDGYKTAEAAEQIHAEVKNIAGIEDIIYRKTLLELLDKRAQTFLWIALAVGVFITVSSIFLVANTIRLAIYAKRKIIQTMKLIGATRTFVRTPFILEGLIQGLVGGVLAAGVIYVAFNYLEQWVSVQLSEFVKVDPAYYGVIVASGLFLGLVGSMISIRRFIGESVAA